MKQLLIILCGLAGLQSAVKCLNANDDFRYDNPEALIMQNGNSEKQ